MSNFKGLKNLMNKSLSVAVAAISSIQTMHAKALELPEMNENDFTDSVSAEKLKPKLVLKLNISNPEAHMLLLHRSHSSHSSHSSHRSHSSHYSSSSYSSGSSTGYSTPTTSSAVYTPTSTTSSSSSGNRTSRTSNSSTSSNIYGPVNKPTTSSNEVNTLYNTNSEKSKTTIIMFLGDRELYKGCQGTDVEELQKILAKLGYDIIFSEYFGDKTEKAVIQFQKDNELKPDGRVYGRTLTAIKRKL